MDICNKSYQSNIVLVRCSAKSYYFNENLVKSIHQCSLILYNAGAGRQRNK